MDQRLCRELFPVPGGVISHGFENSADRFLIVFRDTSKLLNQTVFDVRKRIVWQCFSRSVNDVRHVKIKERIRKAQI